MISDKFRDSGIKLVEKIPWGTHFCYFYLTKEDLINVLLPYFKKGLENNEYCIWITSSDLSEQDAKNAMRDYMSDFDEYLKNRQIEIIPYSNWYLKENTLNFDFALNSWIEKLDRAKSEGYEGIRITGDTRWLKKANFEEFISYEARANDLLVNYDVIAICSYPINKFRKCEFLDIANTHKFVLFNRSGKLTIIENYERKRVEEDLKNFSLFSSGIAHDFNKLLTIIKGNADMAMMEIDKNSNMYKYLKEISQSIKSASPLVKQLYNFNFKQSVKPKDVDVNETVNKLLEMFSLFFDEDTKIDVETDLCSELWKISANPSMVEQIIMNLVLNARDAMPDGGKLFIKTKNVEVDKSYQKENAKATPGKHICLSIEDTGIGIDENAIKQIFEPFFTTKESGKGMGLGLSIVQCVVDENNGWVNVYSKPNKGTKFKVYLPASNF